jgi:2-keto-4-pentenoate hydratase/2-oxohepta-3-ene-1,7-dioic acid hydratase in catechol pathway
VTTPEIQSNRLARFGPPGEEVPTISRGETTFDLRPITRDIDYAFLASDGIAVAAAAAAANALPEFDYTGLRRGSPIARPGKIVCIGLNYRDHARETGAEIPDEPVVFLKDPSTVVGPFDQVLIPRRSVKTDWEVELGVVIGRRTQYLDSPTEAPSAIAGYVLSHDVSEREFQLERGGQWDKGKSCETFNPLGPVLVPSSEIPDPQNLQLKLWVNGTLRQSGSTSDMIFGVHHIVWYLSQFMVLHPGDLINTGTPAGVALGIPGNPYLRPGDVIELSITGLGRARQEVVSA